MQPLKHDRWRIPKSRYASNSTYISEDSRLRKEYLDPNLVIDPDVKQQLMNGGMDDRLATHFAHLFIRDPIVVFAEDLKELERIRALVESVKNQRRSLRWCWTWLSEARRDASMECAPDEHAFENERTGCETSSIARSRQIVCVNRFFDLFIGLTLERTWMQGRQGCGEAMK